MKLITKQTIQELSGNIEAEMLPFYSATKNVIGDVKNIIKDKIEKPKSFRFLELSNEQMQEKFPIFLQHITESKKIGKLNENDVEKYHQIFNSFVEKYKKKDFIQNAIRTSFLQTKEKNSVDDV